MSPELTSTPSTPLARRGVRLRAGLRRRPGGRGRGVVGPCPARSRQGGVNSCAVRRSASSLSGGGRRVRRRGRRPSGPGCARGSPASGTVTGPRRGRCPRRRPRRPGRRTAGRPRALRARGRPPRPVVRRRRAERGRRCAGCGWRWRPAAGRPRPLPRCQWPTRPTRRPDRPGRRVRQEGGRRVGGGAGRRAGGGVAQRGEEQHRGAPVVGGRGVGGGGRLVEAYDTAVGPGPCTSSEQQDVPRTRARPGVRRSSGGPSGRS